VAPFFSRVYRVRWVELVPGVQPTLAEHMHRKAPPKQVEG
jgi:hypothetical protein